MSRFQRQEILPEVGRRGQELLRGSRVLIVGAGGLGHPALQYLVGMGVGEIGIIDGDTVQESNLHRQILFKDTDVGLNKANCAKRFYKERQESVTINAYPFFLSKDSAVTIFPEYDVVIDGTDNFQTKFLINDVCVYLDKPLVYGSVSQFEGQVSVFWGSKGPCYRCLVPDVPRARIRNCAESGIIGAIPGIIGSAQAFEAFKVLMCKGDQSSTLLPSFGVLQHFDFAKNESRSIKIPRRKYCCCSNAKFDLVNIDDIEMNSEECAYDETRIFLDVREEKEWAEFHLPDIPNWALSRLESGDLPVHLKSKKVTAICVSGARAERAFRLLVDKGFDINFTCRSIYGLENWKR